jgi:hypothetical protein
LRKADPISKDLIAPCGMTCAICSRYLAHINNFRQNQCAGCRPSNKECSYLFGKCTGINHAILTGDAAFCTECEQYPCKEIKRMDKRYRENYKMSVKDNLEFISNAGIDKFTEKEYEKHHCSKCGGLISIHNRKCFKCDTIMKLVEKYN